MARTSTGNTFPTVGASVDRAGSTAWTNPGNVVSDNTTDTTSAVPTDYLVTSSYGFSVPTGSHITGVTVRVEASETGAGTSNFVPQLHSDTTPTLIGSAKTAVTVSGTGKSITTSGSSTDLWSATLSPATVNATGFGVSIWSTDTTNTLEVDFITIDVAYIEPLTAAQATFTHTGNAATLTYGKTLNCGGAQTFTLTGNATGFLRGKVLVCSGAGGSTQVSSDDFSSALSGYTTVADTTISTTSGYVTIDGGLGTATGVAWKTGVTYENDSWSEVTVDSSWATSGTHAGVAFVRRPTTGTPVYRSCYGAWFSNASSRTLYLYKWNDSGTPTSLGTYLHDSWPSSVVRITAIGTSIKVIVDGTEVISVTDSTYTSGVAGFGVESNPGGTAKLTDWAAGNLTAGFVVTGSETNLKYGHTLSCSPNQTFTLTGIAATLTPSGGLNNYTLDCTPNQTFALTGNNTLFHRTIRCDQATFALTGNDSYRAIKISAGGAVCALRDFSVGADIVSDSFTAANYPGSPILGDTANWDRWDTDASAVLNVNSTFEYVTRSAPDQYAGAVLATSFFSGLTDYQVRLVSTSGSNAILNQGPLVRATSGTAKSGYLFSPASSNSREHRHLVQKVTDETYTTIADTGPFGYSPVAGSTGYVVRLQVRGNKLIAVFAGVVQAVVHDDTFATGQPGMFSNQASNLDTFTVAGLVDGAVLTAQRKLTCDQATFTLGSFATGLNVGKSLTCSTGTFTLTGIDATLTYDSADATLTAVTGSFTLTGTTVQTAIYDSTGLTVSVSGSGAYQLQCSQATFALTGIAANLLRGEVLPLDAGTFTLTGNTTNLLRGARLDAAPQQTFTLTGTATALNHGYRLTCSPDSTLVLSGTATNLLAGRKVTADQQTYTLTGNALTFARGVRLDAAPNQTFTLTGYATLLDWSGSEYNLALETATFTLTGVAATFKYSKLDATPNQTFTLTGNALNFLRGKVLPLDQATFTLTGNALTLTRGEVFTLDTVAFDLTGIAANLKRGARLDAAPQQTFSLTGNAATLNYGRRFDAAPNQTFTLTGTATALNRGRTLNATPNQTFVLTGVAANLNRGRTLSATPNQTFVLTGIAANFLRGEVLPLDTQAFTLTGNAANLLRGARLDAAPNQTFNLTGYAALLDWSGSDYTLAAETASFTLTGIAATLKYSKLTAEVGTFALTGNALTLTRAERLVLDTVAFDLTGIAANLKHGALVNAAPNQTFVLTGNDAALSAQHKLTAEVGTFTLTGNALTLTRGERLALDSGTFTLTGNALNRVATFTVGTFTLTGNALGLNHGYTLACIQATFALTGNATNLLRGGRLATDVAAFTLTGNAANLLRGEQFDAAPNQTFVLLGNATTFKYSKLLAESGAFTLTGYPLTFSTAGRMFADPVAFTLTGNAANLLHGAKLALDAGSFALTGNATALNHGYRLTAETGTFALTGNTANLNHGYSMGMSTRAFLLTGNAVNLLYGPKVALDSGSFTLTGNAASFQSGEVLDATPNQTFVLTGNAATLTYRKLALDTGTFLLTGNELVFSETGVLYAAPGSFTLTGNSLELLRGERVALDSGGFSLTGNALELLRGERLSLDSGSFALTGIDATLTYAPITGFTLTANTGVFNLNSNATNLVVNRYLNAKPNCLFTLTGNAISFNETAVIAAITGTFNLNGIVTGLYRNYKFTLNTTTFTLNGNAATLKVGEALPITNGVFILTGNAAQLRINRLTCATAIITLTGNGLLLRKHSVIELNRGLFTLAGINIPLWYSEAEYNVPDERVILVAEELRCATPIAETRGWIVEEEIRTMLVANESRYYLVAFEDRTMVVLLDDRDETL
jgi:hypothetical protein